MLPPPAAGTGLLVDPVHQLPGLRFLLAGHLQRVRVVAVAIGGPDVGDADAHDRSSLARDLDLGAWIVSVVSEDSEAAKRAARPFQNSFHK